MIEDVFCVRYLISRGVGLFGDDRAVHADASWTSVEALNRRSRTKRDDRLLRIIFL